LKNNTKNLISFSLGLLILTLIITPGCITPQNSSAAGNYVNTEDPVDYIELHSDGTLIDHPSGTTTILYGKYEINGNKIRVFSSDGSPTNEYQFVNNSIIVDRGANPLPPWGHTFSTYTKQTFEK
jgi:hypothetical protein